MTIEKEMMMARNVSRNAEITVENPGGTGGSFVGLLTIAFIILKLVGTISWSWWWVLSPLWISGGIAILILFFIFLYLAMSD